MQIASILNVVLLYYVVLVLFYDLIYGKLSHIVVLQQNFVVVIDHAVDAMTAVVDEQW